MNSRRDRMRTNVEGDRISSLPDELIAKILSFIDTKQAVETSVLSSRWRFIWTKLPYLKFSSKIFSTLDKFHNFFTHVTSYCNNQVEISLDLHDKGSQELVQRILNHACSHNLQQLTFTFLHEKYLKFPFSLFSTQSLKHLTLIGFAGSDWITPTSMGELPALTTLHLENITLHHGITDKCVGLFSNCTNLKNLTIKSCLIMGSDSFTICHPQLSNLTLQYKWCENDVNVVAPQLKNLTIINWNGELRISAPDLTSMLYKNRRFQLSLDVDNLSSLEKVGLCISNLYEANEDAHRVVDVLQKFNHVKFLRLSLEIIEFLSSFVEAIAHQPSPFVNLRSLKIHPELYNIPRKRKLTMSTEIKNYLLDSSPGATFTMVTREEIKAVRDTKSAQNLMAELREQLDLMKAQIEEKEEDKRKMQLDMGNRVAQVHSYSEDVNEDIKQGEKKASYILSLMQQIEGIVKELPTSNKADLLTHLSTLRTEAYTVVGKILNPMKIEFDIRKSNFAAGQSSS